MSEDSDPGPDGGPGLRARRLADTGRRAIDDGRPAAALPLLEQAASLAPDDPAVRTELGRALNNLRRLPEARAAFEEAVRLDRGSAVAWNGLGHVCRALGDLDAAGDAFQRAVALQPDSARVLSNLASVHLTRGNIEDGLHMLRQAATLDGSDPRVRCLLGDALQSRGRHVEAAAAYAEALEIDAGHADALAGMGAVMDALGRYADAERLLRTALDRRPGDPVAAASLTHVLELQGRGEEVLALIESCRWAHPPGWAMVAEARQLFQMSRPVEAEACLADADPAQMDPATKSAALNLQGRILDARDECAAAWRMFEAANLSQPADFDPAAFRAAVDGLIGFFTRERMASLPRSGCDSDRPVFIVGMPRSGTSLVEQMLGAHSRVLACGERTDLYQLPRRLSGGRAAQRWPGCLADMDSALLSRAAAEYLEGCPTAERTATRVTDKLPANFLNLGLVQLMFPSARVIYCRRDPMDTGLSCFQQDFRSPGMGFARDLAFIGLYQRACLRLMEHWQAVLDLAIYTVEYEDLVSAPESGARAMIEYLGLEWEDACLRFHESGRVVRTASYDQVRRPVYVSSVGRWRRYDEWLGPLREALAAPWHEENGQSGP
jgi:Flp pilus assembly protein TadD